MDRLTSANVILDARRGQKRTTLLKHGQRNWEEYLGVLHSFLFLKVFQKRYVSFSGVGKALGFEDRVSARFFFGGWAFCTKSMI